MRSLSFVAAVITSSLITSVGASPYTDAAARYRDLPFDSPATTVAISYLTQEGVIGGYPDRTFHAERGVNRAEFMKVALGAYTRVHESAFGGYDWYRGGTFDAGQHCLPDVSLDDWFGMYVCEGKFRGFVNGFPDGLFHPDRPVNYAEAVKILVLAFDLPPSDQPVHEWYDGFIHMAQMNSLELSGKQPGDALTRGDTAALAAPFLAFGLGELPAFRAEESGSSSSASSVSCDPYVCPDGTIQPSCTPDGHQIMYFADPCLTHQARSSSSSASSVSSTSSVSFDPDSDTSTTSNIFLLGTTSHVLGAAKIFSNSEPINVTSFEVDLVAQVASIEALLLFDHDGKYLGRASYDSGTTYVLPLRTGSVQIPHREDSTFYARAVVKRRDRGGVSGETFAISAMRVKGDGAWSTHAYEQESTDDFNEFQTARSVITSITNAGVSSEPLMSGVSQEIGAFRFAGTVGAGDGTAKLEVTDLTFSAALSGGIGIENVELGADGTNDRADCSLSANVITCMSIPASFGTLESGPRTLTLYADITIPSDATNGRLSVSLNTPGSPSSAGSVTWTDGTTIFAWVPFALPVARGTAYAM
ncbi:MAG: S-layer homology domain-containing protein [Candidatus Peregrinibacteria bacterium]